MRRGLKKCKKSEDTNIALEVKWKTKSKSDQTDEINCQWVANNKKNTKICHGIY